MLRYNRRLIAKCAAEIGVVLLQNQNNSQYGFKGQIFKIIEERHSLQLYVVVDGPLSGLYGEDDVFPSELLFCKKGMPFYLKAWGNATIVDRLSPTGNNPAAERTIHNKNTVLINIKIDHFYYHQYQHINTSGVIWKDKIKTWLMHLFILLSKKSLPTIKTH